MLDWWRGDHLQAVVLNFFVFVQLHSNQFFELLDPLLMNLHTQLHFQVDLDQVGALLLQPLIALH